MLKPQFKLRDILPVRANLSAYSGAVNSLDEITKLGVGGGLEYINYSGTIRNHGTTIVNSDKDSLFLTLKDAHTEGVVKEILMENATGNTIVVKLSRGSFRLNMSRTYCKLIYVNNQWRILSNTNDSFYPLKQISIPLVGIPYIGERVAQGSSISLSSDASVMVVGSSGDHNKIGAVYVYEKNKHDSEMKLQEKLVSNEIVGEMSGQGFSVALSSMGTTLAVGAPTDNYLRGCVFVYIKIDVSKEIPTNKYVQTTFLSSWVLQEKISSTNSSLISSQGCSVALSSDGNVLVYGANEENEGVGSVWVWIRNEMGMWREQTKIISSDLIGKANFGTSVSLSSDGSILAIGASSDNENIGATFIYRRINGLWTQITKIIVPDNIGTAYCGFSVAINSSGKTLAIGGIGDNNFYGAIWIYQYINDFWRYEQKIIGSGAIGISPKQGTSVCLSGDGNTLSFGGTDDNNGLGATWVFIRENNTNWIQIEKLVIVGTTPSKEGITAQGISLALSNNGSTLAISSLADNNVGSVTLFT